MHRQLPLRNDLKAPRSSLPLRNIPPPSACLPWAAIQDGKGPYQWPLREPGAVLSDLHTLSTLSSKQSCKIGINSEFTTQRSHTEDLKAEFDPEVCFLWAIP